MKILITGATGFVASELIRCLNVNGHELIGTVRNEKNNYSNVQLIQLGDISPSTNWITAISDCDVVIHTAGRAHVLNDLASDKLYEFRKVNYYGTINLARQSAIAGIKRFIFISTIGVNGNETKDSFFDESNQPMPYSPYAVSKYEAEIGLREIEKETGMEVVIIRPPLVCGAHAPGNLDRLFKLVNNLSVFPFRMANNKRSLVSLDNLVNFINLCITHPNAKGETFVISDDEIISTKEIIQIISLSLDKSCNMLPIPPILFSFLTKLLKREGIYQQLFCDLIVNNAKAKKLLGWTPIITTQDALYKAARTSILNIK